MDLGLADSGLWIMGRDGRWLMVRGWKSAPSPVFLEVPSGGNAAVYSTPWPTREYGRIVIQQCTTACVIRGSRPADYEPRSADQDGVSNLSILG